MESVKKCTVPCLERVEDLQALCENHNIQFSTDTNTYALYLTLEKLGPVNGQKLIKKLVERGDIKWDRNEDFEVEAILDYAKEEDGSEFYLIKWEGWGHTHNTWEPKDNLNCSDLMESFQKIYELAEGDPKLIKRHLAQQDESQDTKRRKLNDLLNKLLNKENEKITPMQLLNASRSPLKQFRLHHNARPAWKVKRRLINNITNKKSKAYKDMRSEVQQALKLWEKRLNEASTDPAPIFVENLVDLEGPLDSFTYTNDYIPGEGVVIPNDPIVGCECTDCHKDKKKCCSASAGAEFAYYKNNGTVRVPPGHPIYECNSRCQCRLDCPNRIVQHGRKYKLCIFRTSNGRGWGVKTMQRIKQGSFVMEYVGEVLTSEEAERRGKQYDAEGRTFLFDLDYNDADAPFTVDARFYGNVSHFVNHSCDPNLAVYGVWINHLDARLPRITLFSQRVIEKGEELTFDYMMTGDTTEKMSTESVPDSGDIPNALTDGDTSEATGPDSNDSEDNGLANGDIETPVANGVPNGVQHHSEGFENISPNRSFMHPSMTSPRLEKYRMRCQCGADNCRKFLY